MRIILWRGIVLSILFLLIGVGYQFLLLNQSLKEGWDVFFDTTIVNLPLGLWIMNCALLLGFGIAFWTFGLHRSKEKAIEARLQAIVDSEGKLESSVPFPPRIKRTLEQVESVISTQRKSLQRLTDERAEAQDLLIQERIVQERQRLARELHDSVSQQLFAASMLLSALTEQAEPRQERQPLQQVERMVQQAQLEMRALLLHLRPAALHNRSLAEGLGDLIEELKEKVQFNIQYRLEEVHLSKGAEDHLFRIAQETLSNTLRHAQATEVDVLFVERDGLAIFRVQDNGVGFQEDNSPSGSYGLQNVRERAVEIGGTCKIVSVPSQGTIVEVKLPIGKGGALDDTDTDRG